MKTRIGLLILALIAAFFVAATSAVHHGALFGALAGIAVAVVFSALLTPRVSACFANNFGVLNNTILVFDAFSQFLENLFPITQMVLDVQDPSTGVREAKPGDTITVKDWRSDVTAYQPESPTGYVTPSNVDISAKDRQLVLPNKPWAVSVALTPEEYRVLESGVTRGTGYTTFRDKITNLMRQGLGRQAISDMFSVITADYPTNFATPLGTFGRATEVDLDAKLFGRNVPADGAQIITTPALFGEWVKDHILIQTYTGENRQTNLLMQGGVKSQNSAFTFWRSNRPMPVAAPRGFALAKTAIIAAFRVPMEATFEADPVSLNTIVDPKTGISCLVRLWKNSGTGIIQMDIAAIWVFARGQLEALERLTLV